MPVHTAARISLLLLLLPPLLLLLPLQGAWAATALYSTQDAAADHAIGSALHYRTEKNASSSTLAGGLVFPSGNKAQRLTGPELHSLVPSRTNGTLQQASSAASPAVILFYSERCPHSMATKPVFECMPAWFPDQVVFHEVEAGDLSLMALMANGVHALPVLQVHARGKLYRYAAGRRHHLEDMLQFVAQAMGQAPLATLDAGRLCSGNASSCGGWQCERWDGEATAEELHVQQQASVLYISILFLVLRVAGAMLVPSLRTCNWQAMWQMWAPGWLLGTPQASASAITTGGTSIDRAAGGAPKATPADTAELAGGSHQPEVQETGVIHL